MRTVEYIPAVNSYATIKRAPQQSYDWGLYDSRIGTGIGTSSTMEEPVAEDVLIDATELRVGDHIKRGHDNEKTRQMGATGVWNVMVVKQNGKLGYMDKYSGKFNAETGVSAARWVAGVKLWVRMPRPEPEVNEFGPITP